MLRVLRLLCYKRQAISLYIDPSSYNAFYHLPLHMHCLTRYNMPYAAKAKTQQLRSSTSWYVIGCVLFLVVVGNCFAISKYESRARDDPTIDCVDGIYNTSCWETLNLTSWLTNWYQTVPNCTTGDTRECRAPDEAWTTTFLRIALNITGGPDCTVLTACLGDAPSSNQIIGLNATEAAKYRYVAYNIYSQSYTAPPSHSKLIRSH